MPTFGRRLVDVHSGHAFSRPKRDNSSLAAVQRSVEKRWDRRRLPRFVQPGCRANFFPPEIGSPATFDLLNNLRRDDHLSENIRL